MDKTAAYVAKNGQSFEALIVKVEANNPKFNFLKHDDDPYRPYYQQKLEECTTGKVASEDTTKTDGGHPDGTHTNGTS